MPESQNQETHTTETYTQERKSSLFSDILTIIGFAILFIIIIWGLIHLIELISSSFSPSKPAPTIQVTAPTQATSGQPVTISWSYSPTTGGSYAFLYECGNGLTFNAQTSTSGKGSIPCGVAYTTASQNNSITVTPILSATSSVSDTVSIVFIPSQGGSEVQGDATITVNPAAKKVTKATTTSNTYTYGSAGGRHSGPADLAVTVISGNINGNGDGTVTFDIANIGGSTSGAYQFSAQLPTAQPYPYMSPIQAPLAPGAHVVSTLNFTDAAPGGGLFSVSILDGNETNSSNDYASMELSGPYNLPAGQTGYNNGYSNYSNYNQQPYLQYPAPTYTY